MEEQETLPVEFENNQETERMEEQDGQGTEDQEPQEMGEPDREELRVQVNEELEPQETLIVADESSPSQDDNNVSEEITDTNLEQEQTQVNDSILDQPTTSPIQNEVEQPTTTSPIHEEMDQIATVSSPQNEEMMDQVSRPHNEEEEQSAPTTSTPNLITTCAPLQTLASGLALARIADFFAQEDERVLRCHGFKAVFIPWRKKEKHHSSSSDHKRKRSPSNNYSGSIRDEAKTPQKRNFAPVVQCCVCELIVSKERFGGRDTLFCSQECISKKAEDARKCVKEGERILVIDHKGAMMNHSNLNPTIENLEEFLLANPSYQPVLASEQIEEANQRLHDPVYQKKVESMRVDVRKAIETALQKRSKSANMNFSLKRYKDLGMEIERSLFSVHQDVNLRYRKWFKSFITVINDEMNGFFRDVLRDKVSVKKLVTLSSDQMNVPLPQKDQANNSFSISSTDIAAPSTSNSSFNIAAAELTSISEMPEENAINESFTSADSISTIRKKIGPTTSRHSMVKKTPLSNVQAKSAIDDILGDMNKDTTHLHQSHLYDANCGVCKQMNLRKFAEKERKERLEAKLEQKRKAEEAKSGSQLSFPNLDPSIQAAMLEASAAETASNELDFLKQNKNRQQRETFDTSPSISNSNNMLLGGDVILGRCDDPIDQERRLRDPLGLESVDALPPEEENVHEEDDN
uniref:TFIIS central domain-containing protein n=1 Tax=Meloidogyne javanica TaxID=6303 RepID=A0A915NDT4_MELJA